MPIAGLRLDDWLNGICSSRWTLSVASGIVRRSDNSVKPDDTRRPFGISGFLSLSPDSHESVVTQSMVSSSLSASNTYSHLRCCELGRFGTSAGGRRRCERTEGSSAHTVQICEVQERVRARQTAQTWKQAPHPESGNIGVPREACIAHRYANFHPHEANPVARPRPQHAAVPSHGRAQRSRARGAAQALLRTPKQPLLPNLVAGQSLEAKLFGCVQGRKRPASRALRTC
eukprot:scaffold175617_cov35-Tisochrysis_lutea.AAC.2